MLDLLAKHSEYAELSFSGDAKFDMFISLIFREADEKGIVLEHIIEQSKENIEVIDRYTLVLKKVIDEIMDRSSRTYRKKKIIADDKPWMRITCRKKGKHILFNVEYSVDQSQIRKARIISWITISKAASLKSEGLMNSSIVADGGNYYLEETDGRGLLTIMFNTNN